MRKPEQKINGMPQFHGPFRELIPDYITYKRGQGYKYREPVVYHLREMDLFFMEMGVQDIRVTREMYEAYTKPHPPEKETTTQKRQQTIRGFAKYLVSLGYTDIYTGYDDTRIFKRDFIPYIFSREETKRMFGVLAQSCIESPCYENDAFRILMLLYYCCGLRKAEAQELKLGDINFETGKISILHGKNDVARIIPVSDSLLAQLRLHRKTYLENPSQEDFFFFREKKRATVAGDIYRKFHCLLTEASIPPRADGGRQRLHDLRHTFCVRTLEQMQLKGFDLYVSLPLLSVYLGHKHITETEYYLRMLDEHFDGILEKSAAYAPDLFPVSEEGNGEG